MATHDYVLDNATGANFRADLNNALAAIVSNNSSSSEPSTKYAYQWWADTNDGVLKIRNSANDGWVTLLQLDGTLTLEDGTNSAPALGFRDDLNTGIFSSAADTLDITCGGTTRGSFSSSGLTVTGNVTATTFVGNVDAVDGDFDGTLEADAITVAGVALATVIAGTTVTTATNANHVSVADNESTNENNLIPFIEDASATGNVGLESDGDFTYNPSTGTVTATIFSGALSGNATTATTATNVTAADESSDTTCFPLFVTAATGDLPPKTGSNLAFNSSNGTLTATTFAGSGASLTGIPAANLTGTASAINGSNITNVDAATLDSIDSSQFLRSDADDSGSGLLTLSSGIAFGDSSKCTAGIKAQSLSGSTLTINAASGIHHSFTLTTNITINFSNSSVTIGQSGSIFLTQDGTGSRTAAFSSAFKFVGGTAPTLSTAANAVDRIDYVVLADSKVHAVASLDVK